MVIKRIFKLLGVLLLLNVLLSQASAWRANIGFMRVMEKRHVFLTLPQASHPGVCSDIVTVRTTNELSQGEVQATNLTVNLSGAGLVFYSDPLCQSAITSVTIFSGTHSQSYYFKPSTTGTLTMTASGGIYADGSQQVESTVNPFIWTGGGANANWNTAANWSGGVVPSATTHTAQFDGSCVSNCSPNINTSINIRGILIESGFTGTVTRTSGFPFTVNSGGWVQHGGTANFSVANHNFTNNGPFFLTAGTFTGTNYGTAYCGSTSPSFTQTGGTFNATASTDQQFWCPVTISGGTFNLSTGQSSFRRGFNWTGGGTVLANPASTFDVNPTTSGFTYHLDGMDVGGLRIRSSSAAITGTFTTRGLLWPDSFGVYTGAFTVNAKGDISFGGSGIHANEMTIRVNGNTLQTISGSNGASPKILFENTRGTSPGVVLTGVIRFAHDYTVVNDNLDASAFEIQIGHFHSSHAPTFTFGNETYSAAAFRLNTNLTTTIVGTLKVSGALSGRSSCCAVGRLNGGMVQVTGNVTKPDFNSHHPATAGGTATYELIGSTDVTIGNSAQITTLGFQSLIINKTAGAKVTQVGQVRMISTGSSMTLTAGSYEMAGFSLDVIGLSLNGNTLRTGGGTLTVNGTNYATSPGTYSIFGGTVINP